MPKMNGIETAAALKRKLPKTQIILFSNYTDDLDRTLASTGIPISQEPLFPRFEAFIFLLDN
jgi:CheY-like chemotaxis protein